MVDVLVRILEVIVQLDDPLLFLLHHIGGDVFNHSLLAPLGCSDTSLLTVKDASFSIATQLSLHQFVDCELDHLCYGWGHVMGR